ncbi:ABC transporter permease [Ohessyouella blattaphilus]|uniref:ABC transporter permease n=1 Tax=Ohessyouella blattaphilus TaxID=2949333 RepID=A0ABT1EHD3_9FIRM|nr:FtsX-like permease family protein [Ohessyouella blattaphilus]MCP1109909.1 ABC transporter permease [Ohessyouella blattaphilus]MCR8563303.1 ABC transporter permease [Ohessyouella blattaphilus]
MGQIVEYIKMALYSILSNKGRSFLTMLGIIIGISSVITVVSIGSGVKSEVMATTEEKSVSVSVDTEVLTNPMIMTDDDILAVKSGLGKRTTGVVATSQGMGTTTTNKGSFDAYLTFATPDAQYDPNMEEMYSGTYFTEDDMANASPVAVIDRESALYVFGNTDVLGMDLDITMENRIVTVRIIGIRDVTDEVIAANKEVNQMFGMEMPISLEMPYTGTELWGEPVNNYSTLSIYLAEGENANGVAKAAMQILAARHVSDGDDIFKKDQGLDLTSYMGTMLDTVTAFIAFVAGISLLVGGIGVMNIMLVSVTERTREIGIRKSLGATTRSIVAQFLFESAIISGIGGIIGILSGAGIAKLISVLNIGGLSSKLSPGAIIIATAFSCGVGIIFGIYPARKAAKLSPIEALRQ